MSDFPVHATKTPAVVASRTVGRVQHAAKLLFSRQRTTHTELGCTMPSLCVCEIEQVRARERRGVGGRSRCAMWSRRARCQRRGEEAHNGSAVRWRGVTTTFLPNTPLVWVSLQPCSTQHKRHDTHKTPARAARLPPTDRKTDGHNGSLHLLPLSVLFVILAHLN